jgi:GDP-L-fucose synthase
MYSTKIKNPMKTIVIRPANLYGPYDKFDKDKAKVIPSLIRKIVEKQNPLEIWGDGKDIKDFIYIDDFINGLLKVSILNKKFNIVNISSSKKISINKIAKILLKLNKMEKWKILHLNDQPSMIPFRLISNKKIKKITDWKINIEMTEGLKKTLRWYKNNIS